MIWPTGIVPKGDTAETIVQNVIEKTFSGVRNWEPERGELLPWLKWVVKSDINHLAESAAHKRSVYLEQFADNESALNKIELEAIRQPIIEQKASSLEAVVIAAETDEAEKELGRLKISLLLDACNGRPELDEIVYAICEGKSAADAQSLAEYLGRPVKDIYQQLRALRRRAEKISLRAEWTKNGQE